MSYVWMYLVAFSFFIVIDLVWLGVVAKNFYAAQLKGLMAEKVNWTAAIIFYLLYVLGLVVIVIAPAMDAQSVLTAFLMGGFVSFLMYATYDLTNLATLKDWPLKMTLIDLVWGASLGALTSGLTVWILLLLGVS